MHQASVQFRSDGLEDHIYPAVVDFRPSLPDDGSLRRADLTIEIQDTALFPHLLGSCNTEEPIPVRVAWGRYPPSDCLGVVRALSHASGGPILATITLALPLDVLA